MNYTASNDGTVSYYQQIRLALQPSFPASYKAKVCDADSLGTA
jgi:hypothetical protein